MKRWFIDAFGAMAMGVFASLLIGTIIGQIGVWTGWAFLGTLAGYAKNGFVVGAAIGAAVANGLKVKPLVMLSAAVVGAIGYQEGGGPVGAYLSALIGSELANLIAGKTRFDILLVPSVSILSGGPIGVLTGPYIDRFCQWIGHELGVAMGLHPVLMGMIVAVVMGLALTAPISSAAIALVVFRAELFDGNTAIALAAGAATVGCCCQMMGFAAASWRDNGFSGFLAQGLGTSMLQIANIVKHPLILIPPTLASLILGPVGATLLTVENTSGVFAGMGTCGLVGPAGAWSQMMASGFDWFACVKIVLLCFVLPALLSLVISEGMRKLGWIKPGDMKLDL
ncbi:MAG: PTS sugar transporter subunit IIC [Clostridia bacterium]|nr:PTS sugar transporter subunit IIC [Clostridia bacterium]